MTFREDYSAVPAARVKDLISYLIREMRVLQLPETRAIEVTMMIPVHGDSQRTVTMTIDKGEVRRVDIR